MTDKVAQAIAEISAKLDKIEAMVAELTGKAVATEGDFAFIARVAEGAEYMLSKLQDYLEGWFLGGYLGGFAGEGAPFTAELAVFEAHIFLYRMRNVLEPLVGREKLREGAPATIDAVRKAESVGRFVYAHRRWDEETMESLHLRATVANNCARFIKELARGTRLAKKSRKEKLDMIVNQYNVAVCELAHIRELVNIDYADAESIA